MIFSDLPSPAEASSQNDKPCEGFAQAGNRYPPRIKSAAGFFAIMLYIAAAILL
jgi:hypothetical protein